MGTRSPEPAGAGVDQGGADLVDAGPGLHGARAFEAAKDRLGGVQEARRRERCQVDVIDDYHWMAGANLYVRRWRLYGSDSAGASSDHRDPRS